MRNKVVVGVDGSQSALDAVRLATREAAWRHCQLRIVHGYIWPLVHVPPFPLPAAPPDGGMRHEAEKYLQRAAETAAQVDPDVEVETGLVEGAPVPVLLAEAESAQLIVLGDRGLGGFSGLLVGSVAVQLAAHSPVPVLVAKGETRSEGPVVVGVDGGPTSKSLLEYAFNAAAYRQARLIAVHTWTHPMSSGPGDMLSPVYDVRLVQDEEERVLAEALAGMHERFPDVKVSQEVVRHHASATLVDRSKYAQLIVVGSRGRGGFTGLLLGSVSQQVLHHGNCPITIVPTR